MTSTRPRVLCIANQKGGVGKSTLTMNIAVEAVRRGVKTAVFDLDDQGSTYDWYVQRTAAAGRDVAPVVYSIAPANLSAAIDRLAGLDLVIVECPPKVQEETAAGLAAADFVLVPLTPTGISLGATKAIHHAIKTAGKPFAFVMNQCPAHRYLTERAMENLIARFDGPEFAPCEIGTWSAFVHAHAQGQGVTEYNASSNAAKAVIAIVAWLLDEKLDLVAGAAGAPAHA
jgi:chromosome partitioning protein